MGILLSGKVVKFIRPGVDALIITERQWQQEQGIEGQKTVRWSKANEFTVLAADLTPEALRYCDQIDPDLIVVDASV